ncbi:hypothetical protein ACH4MO_14085 [Streptomyces globisporus]|uniref:hypothetical protein n=1 Tax=Streptomyces globisporus TaxID=1908 RepID=UPI0037BDA85A
MITPPLGRILDTSRQRCTFSPGDTDEATCKTPASWHVAWSADMENGLACDEHMAVAQQYAYLDRHQVGGDCSMPGSSWDFDRKRCFIDGCSSPESAVAEQSMPLEAS